MTIVELLLSAEVWDTSGGSSTSRTDAYSRCRIDRIKIRGVVLI
ncbi:hypothetical protein [Micromonospora sp. RTGN7]|nr:hypothetical protein [Micromonospora sp. RTGN7]